ncbi:helix-turn-helix domain-containing protein [Corynebacterium striatum]
MRQIDIISARTAARMMGLSHTHLIRLTAKGDIPALGKLHGKRGALVFDKAEIEKLAQQKAARLRAQAKELESA